MDGSTPRHAVRSRGLRVAVILAVLFSLSGCCCCVIPVARRDRSGDLVAVREALTLRQGIDPSTGR